MSIHKNVVVAVFLFSVLLVGGAYIYHIIEGWKYLDSLYFVVMTATTVGYGDFVPKTDAGKIFTMFFSFLGVVFAFYLISISARALFAEHLGKKVSEIKRDVREDVKEDVERDVKRDVRREVVKSEKKKKR